MGQIDLGRESYRWRALVYVLMNLRVRDLRSSVLLLNTLHNNPEEHRSHIHGGGNLISRNLRVP